jgi:hypothetical protein
MDFKKFNVLVVFVLITKGDKLSLTHIKKINEMCILANPSKNWGTKGDDCALFIYVNVF